MMGRHCRAYNVCHKCGHSFWCCNEIKKTYLDGKPCHCVLHVWIDGCCLGNGQPGAKCGIGIWFSDYSDSNVSEGYVPGEQTNQRAELYAAIRALEICYEIVDSARDPCDDDDDEEERGCFSKGIIIHSDSTYVVNIITSWMATWKKRGWRTRNGAPVANKDLLLILDNMLIENVHIEVRAGHIDREHNVCADQLSKQGAEIH